jgi:preprotein translocase subunit YajC
MLTTPDTPWPTLLAQVDDTVPPAVDPSDNVGGATATGDGTATTQAPGDVPGPNPAPPSSPLGSILFPMVLVLGVLFMFSIFGGRKEKKRKAEMLASLAKGAKVQTVGGVLGTIVDVRDDEVLVKVDESSNTRMRFAKSAISAVTNEE